MTIFKDNNLGTAIILAADVGPKIADKKDLRQKFDGAWKIREEILDKHYGPKIIPARIEVFLEDLDGVTNEIEEINKTAELMDRVSGLYVELNETDYLVISAFTDSRKLLNIRIEPDTKGGMEQGLVHDYLSSRRDMDQNTLLVYSGAPDSYGVLDETQTANVLAELNHEFVESCHEAGISDDDLVGLAKMRVEDEGSGEMRIGASLGMLGTMRDIRENTMDLWTMGVLEKAVADKKFYTAKVHKQKTNG